MIWYAAAKSARVVGRSMDSAARSAGSAYGRTSAARSSSLTWLTLLPLPRQALQGGSHQDRDIDLWIFMH
jgi:hypothetical protein